MHLVGSFKKFECYLRNIILRRKGILNKAKPPDRREYTFMLVPHRGNNVFRLKLSIKTLKYSAGVLSILMILGIGTMINYWHEANVARGEKAELIKLRQINAEQSSQIEDLAKATAVLQEDMNRLDRLDGELRRIVNSEDLPASRSGTNRPSVSDSYNGQGGPNVKPQLNELIGLVQDLQKSAIAREQSLINLREAIAERNARLAATPSIWPANGEVTSRYGWRTSPWTSWHPGIDIANNYGTPIVATADGEVIYSGWYSGYGLMVQISHGNGMVTVYGHTSQTIVRVGDRVKKGQTIAYMGSTGASTGTHVHYEVRVNGTAVNPAKFL